ncbi:MAG: hydroxyacylglutathione hydrolase [Deltaproteobacteria bacterium]|nr:hydroxyacylglutathione hydrolase [Deltaproteobacteria bacterium]
MTNPRIEIVPLLNDNYGYLLADETGEAAIVDPAEAEVVLAAAHQHQLRLTTVLATHHHGDHVGGNLELAARIPRLRIVGYAADRDRIPGLTLAVEPGDVVQVGQLRGALLAVPCHTRGHVAYHFGRALFTGDTLFAAGCGRFFEGDAAQMYQALHQVFGALPDDTLIYCGHEYTENNLRFAASLEPNNPAIHAAARRAAKLRAEGRPTIPTTLGEERSYNPFLRVRSPELLASVQRAHPGVEVTDPVAVLGVVRAMKDHF